uniref:Translocon Sec61/SecY plug domain-containing protein n=1 Tax=Setaria viridis TaxID=4556 RepID=A0A4U6UCX7_SETVI|nr:hypothetical protein SEVIR_5G045100v2 [Setaria viridis]
MDEGNAARREKKIFSCCLWSTISLRCTVSYGLLEQCICSFHICNHCLRATPRVSQKVLPQNYVLGALSKSFSPKNIPTHNRSLITGHQYFKIGHVIEIGPSPTPSCSFPVSFFLLLPPATQSSSGLLAHASRSRPRHPVRSMLPSMRPPPAYLIKLMAHGSSALDLVWPLATLMPAVRRPNRMVPFHRRALYTGLSVSVFLVCSHLSLYGIRYAAFDTDPLYWVRSILASNRGTLMELDVGPIVTAGTVAQLLTASKLIPVDQNVRADCELVDGARKVLTRPLCSGRPPCPSCWGCTSPSARSTARSSSSSYWGRTGPPHICGATEVFLASAYFYGKDWGAVEGKFCLFFL